MTHSADKTHKGVFCGSWAVVTVGSWLIKSQLYPVIIEGRCTDLCFFI